MNWKRKVWSYTRKCCNTDWIWQDNKEERTTISNNDNMEHTKEKNKCFNKNKNQIKPHHIDKEDNSYKIFLIKINGYFPKSNRKKYNKKHVTT